jgi:hypothetical protein
MDIDVKGGQLTVTVKQAGEHDGPYDTLTGCRTKLIEAEVNVAGTVTIRKVDYAVNVDYRWLPVAREVFANRQPTGARTHWQEDYRWNGGYYRADNGKTLDIGTATREALEAFVAEVLEKFNDVRPEWQKESYRMRLVHKISHARGQIEGREKEIAEYSAEIDKYQAEMDRI